MEQGNSWLEQQRIKPVRLFFVKSFLGWTDDLFLSTKYQVRTEDTQEDTQAPSQVSRQCLSPEQVIKHFSLNTKNDCNGSMAFLMKAC